MNGKGRGPTSRRSTAAWSIALLSAGLLVVALVGGVVLARGLIVGMPPVHVVSLTPTRMAVVTPKANAPSRFPYSAAAPGPGCDFGGAAWTASPSIGETGPGAEVTCAHDRTHLTAVNPGCSACQWSGSVIWSLELADQADSSPWVLSNFVLSIDLANLTVDASAQVVIALSNPSSGKDYELRLTVTRVSRTAFRYEAFTTAYSKVGEIALVDGSLHTLTLDRRGILATFKVDGVVLASGNLGSVADVGSITLAVLSGTEGPASVEFANLVVQPVP